MGAGLLEDPIAPQEEPLYQAAEDQIPEEQVVYQESAVYEERAASAYDNYEEQEQQAIVAAQRSLVPSIPEDAPVFTGPVYNLESYDNLPAPLESHQHMEQIEGNPDDPFAPTRYRLVTTHILPPLMVYAPPTNPIRERPIRKRVAKKAWDAPLGELVLDPLAPDGIAVKLLLLEAQAPFVIHEVDPSRESCVSVANPQGKLPCWLDADATCIWEANAIMRYVCDKHDLDPQFYFSDDDNLKWRTDMALDWCHTSLTSHIRHVLDPEAHEYEDLSDMPGGRYALETDYRVLSDFFLRETPFIGGEEPNIADYAICLQLLILYSTSHPPPDRIRQYLHNAAEHVGNWNEITLPIREFCMFRQKELRQAQVDMERLKYEDDIARRHQMAEQMTADTIQRRQESEDQMRAQWEADARRREEEDRRWREDQDAKVRADWEAKRRADADKRKGWEADQVGTLEAEQKRLMEERRKRLEAEQAWQEEYFERMRKLREEDEMRRAEMSRKASTISTASTATTQLRPQLGVEIKMLDDSKGNKDCVVAVERVVSGGPCDKAGLKDEDVIDRWNGERIYSKAAWTDKAKHAKIGEVVTLTVYRDGEAQDMQVTVGGTTKTLGSTHKVKSRGSVSHNIRYQKPSMRQPSMASKPSMKR